MKMIVKMATRSRPKKFIDVMELYFDYLSGNHEVRFVITCDLDDETMNNDEMKSWFSKAKEKYDIDVFYGNSKSKVEACNADLENEEGDIHMYYADARIPFESDATAQDTAELNDAWQNGYISLQLIYYTS